MHTGYWRHAPPWPKEWPEIEVACLIYQGMVRGINELDRGRTLWVVWWKRERELEYGAFVVAYTSNSGLERSVAVVCTDIP